MVILRLGKEDARVSSHLRALRGKWAVIFWPEVFKIFIFKERGHIRSKGEQFT